MCLIDRTRVLRRCIYCRYLLADGCGPTCSECGTEDPLASESIFNTERARILLVFRSTWSLLRRLLVDNRASFAPSWRLFFRSSDRTLVHGASRVSLCKASIIIVVSLMVCTTAVKITETVEWFRRRSDNGTDRTGELCGSISVD